MGKNLMSATKLAPMDSKRSTVCPSAILEIGVGARHIHARGVKA